MWWFRIKGTVIGSIWWQVALMIVYTAVVVNLKELLDISLNFPMSLIQIIGVVVGLLLAFRTNSAYDRYWEGRKLWSTMTVQVRCITRTIWISVKGHTSKDLIEKKSAINLCVAFVIATKHYLREEYSYDSIDLKALISHLPRLSTPSSNMPLESQTSTENIHESPSPSPTPVKYSNGEEVDLEAGKGTDIKGYKLLLSAGSSGKSTERLMAYDLPVPSNIPIELSHYMLSYITYIQDEKLADSYVVSALMTALNSLVDCLTSFERILRTPIPLAYSVHLQHSVWLYMLSLPYQLVGTLHWWTIPIVGLGSFCLLGILSIGWEIENPFGYDDNDLPLDDFCQVIRREVDMITARASPQVHKWLHTRKNLPFGSRSDLNAIDLVKKEPREIHHLLSKYATPDGNLSKIKK